MYRIQKDNASVCPYDGGMDIFSCKNIVVLVVLSYIAISGLLLKF